MAEGYTAAELASMRLPGLPTSVRAMRVRADRDAWTYTEQRGNGGVARRFDVLSLPAGVQAALLDRKAEPSSAASVVDAPKAHVEIANEKARIVGDVVACVLDGVDVREACRRVCAGTEHAPRTVRRWYELCSRLPRETWCATLLPKWSGPQTTVACHPDAFACFRDDYLRPSCPGYRACYERMLKIAQHAGWQPIPSLKTLVRMIERDVPATTLVLRRHGREALERLYPAQERTREHFGALGALTADGHKFDVLVRWPGIVEPVRVMMVAFQDLYSGKILSWRVDLSEHANLARLALADLVTTYGIPEAIYLDNGRAWASKTMTGGTAHRFRFKVRDEDPIGILVQLGVKVHWTTPYHGQAKPIERAFGDMCERIAKHPSFEGAYTGRSPTAKPSNYGSRAIDLPDFLRVLDAQIREHNARAGRTAKACAGRSFDATFDESYAQRPIRKATEAQQRFLLLAAEGLTVRTGTASLHLSGNRYWSDALIPLVGERVVARFDPDHLQSGLHVYRLDGRYVGFANCVEATGFDNVQAAREHIRSRRAWVKAATKAAQLEQTFQPAELGEMHLRAQGVPAAAPSARVIKPVFNTPKAPPSPALASTREERELEQRSTELLLELGAEARAGLRPRRASNE